MRLCDSTTFRLDVITDPALDLVEVIARRVGRPILLALHRQGGTDANSGHQLP